MEYVTQCPCCGYKILITIDETTGEISNSFVINQDEIVVKDLLEQKNIEFG